MLCVLGLFGFFGCKVDKPDGGVHDLSMGGEDLTSEASCANTKCQNLDAKCCNGEPCVDVTANLQNCGDCGHVCRTRELCSNGVCTCTGGGHMGACASGAQCCPDGCHDTMNEVANCGGCNLACKMGETCQAGKCSCGPAGKDCTGSQSCCGTGCADLQTDAKNCGICGKACDAGKPCINGVCKGECVTCGMGESCCGGVCTNLLSDKMNCHTCGHVCPLLFGVPLPCVLGFCVNLGADGGMDAGSGDMSLPHD